MEEKYIAILGGLVGSAFTIIVSKIFEYFQTKQVHNLAIKKEFFLRKLNVFEKTASYLTIAHTSITNMAILLKAASNENVSFSNEQSKDIFTRLEQNIQKVYEVTQETANAIDLYVDLKHDEKEVEDTQVFWELLGTINQLSQEVSYYYDLLNMAKTTDDYRKIETVISIRTKALETNIKSLFDLSNIIRKKYSGVTTLLREKLKKYE